jgi:anti-sigma factor RsiW
MASLLEQLDRESMLLLYLAEELPATERAEVERRLASDGSLASELDQIRHMHDAIGEKLAAADGASSLPMACETAVRRASRAMKQWHVDRVSKPPAAGPMRHPFHVPWWGYAGGVAAAIIVGVVIWSSNIPDAGTQMSAEEIQQHQALVAQDLQNHWEKRAEQDAELAYAGNPQPTASSSDQVMDEIFMRADSR